MARIRRLLGRLASHLEALLFLPHDLMPPLHLRWRYFGGVGRHTYRRLAKGAARELLSRGLESHHRVLDVGSGLGPLAVGLIPHLTTGSYEGFDVCAEAVAWCQSAISPRHCRFRFHHANIFNNLYNPRGELAASAYRFPFDDAAFDFVFLGSLCTHLLAADVAHYLHETARVLRPHGKCVVSFYLLCDSSRRGIEAGTSSLRLVHTRRDGSQVIDPQNPETAIAHPEPAVRRACERAGLQIAEPVHRGRWHEGVADEQDVIEAVKIGGSTRGNSVLAEMSLH